jgi:hypothetical protein
MQDKELYQHLLGLTAPWTVSEVKLDMQSQEIHVKVEHPRGEKFWCPDSQKKLPCYDHGEERQWSHRYFLQFKMVFIDRIGKFVTYCAHRVTNKAAKGTNSIVNSINRRASGYRNIEKIKKAFVVYGGGLDGHARNARMKRQFNRLISCELL